MGSERESSKSVTHRLKVPTSLALASLLNAWPDQGASLLPRWRGEDQKRKAGVLSWVQLLYPPMGLARMSEFSRAEVNTLH